MVRSEKRVRGRKSLPDELKRRQFSTLFDPNFYTNFQQWCINNKISQGKALEIGFSFATNNFEKDLTLIK